jgi:hypothetical protein
VATGPTFFDAASAIRIANAVRRVEIGDRSEKPLEFDAIPPTSQRKVFRIATFSGAWSIGATKTVTFKYQTSTPNTANVSNLFFPIVGTATSSVDCAIAKDGTAWFLIDVPLATATAVFVASTASVSVIQQTATAVFVGSLSNQTVVSDIAVAASLNTISCAITVSRTQTTSSVSVVGSTSTGVRVVSTTAAIAIGSTYTATYLRIGVS